VERVDPRPSVIMGFPRGTHRLSALSGAVAAVLLVVSFLIVGTDFPTYDDTGREFARFYAENDSSIELSNLLGVTGVAAFVWFAAFVRWQYGLAEQGVRGFQRATPIAFGASIAGAAISLVFFTAHQAAVIAQGTVEPGVVRALDLFGGFAIVTAAVFLSVLLVASFFMTRVTNVLPQWLAYVAMVGTAAGVIQSLLFVSPGNDNGALGAVAYVWFAAFIVWLLGASVTLARRVI
jgi:hypothetical protein